MKKIVCEMCECMEFAKENNMFVCQGCGCKYSLEDAKKMMIEVDEDITRHRSNKEKETDNDQREGFTKHTSESNNRIWVSVNKVGHEIIDSSAVTIFSNVNGEVPMKFVEGPDHLGRSGASITVKNLAGKCIKYATVYLTPYNIVGDAVFCSIGDHSTYGIQITGPLTVGESYEGYSDGMWYNNTIVSARVEYVTVEYMDGTKEWFEGEIIHKNVGEVTVSYEGNAGAAGVLVYNFDGGEKNMLHKGESAKHNLELGKHNFKLHSLFLNKEHNFEVKKQMKIKVYGKSFGHDIIEE